MRGFRHKMIGHTCQKTLSLWGGLQSVIDIVMTRYFAVLPLRLRSRGRKGHYRRERMVYQKSSQSALKQYDQIAEMASDSDCIIRIF